jgi:hypothetical protein
VVRDVFHHSLLITFAKCTLALDYADETRQEYEVMGYMFDEMTGVAGTILTHFYIGASYYANRHEISTRCSS